MSNLNPQQQAAVRFIDNPLLVLAGAGSGKTRVITQKIAYLIASCGIKAHCLVAVTFTNKAAREMKERVTKLLPAKQLRGLMVATFHQLGLKIIRHELKRLDLKPGFSIFDHQDSLSLLRELNHPQDNDYLMTCLQQISTWKNQGLTPTQALNQAAGTSAQQMALLYQQYQKHLHAYNAVDFDDLIGLPVQLLQNDSEAREYWQAKVRYMLVDEYQDTNECQYQLIRLLTGMRAAFTVVGDDDQSVYTWRGARPENLQQLQQDYPKLQLIKLEQNYRSSGRILKAANSLISHNPHLFDKKLWSQLGFGDPLRVICCKDEEAEAQRVVTELISHKFRYQTRFQDYAILYRGNHQARVFEKVLRDHKIPYFLSGGTSFFARSEIKDIMAYLRILINPDDDNALLRIINVPRRGIGAATLEALGRYAKQRHISLFTASFEIGLEQELTPQALAKLRQFTTWLVRVADNAERGETLAVLHEMLKTMDYENWLIENNNTPKAVERKMHNIHEFFNWLGRLLKGDGEETTDLKTVVGKMMLIDMLEQQAEQDQADKVQLMTLHAAKGLEFPHVFMVGMEEELLPHRNSIELDNFEEERRLAYVGMTRAQQSLCFTLARQRKRFGEWVDCEPSRFLKELPVEDLEWEGHAIEVTEAQRRERGSVQLENLRSLLAAKQVQN